MEQYRGQTKRFLVSGTEVLRCRISLPFWEGRDSMSGFYEEMKKEALSFCEGALLSMAESEFAACDDPKKRFSFPSFLYTLEGRVTWEDREREWLTVRLEARLSRRGGGALLEQRIDGQAWALPEECLLPPEQLAQVFGLRRLRRGERKESTGVFVDRGALWLCKDGRAYSVEAAKNRNSRKK